MKALPIYVEIAPKRAFAGALDWPGWCRSGRTEHDAIAALVAYRPRYGAVATRAGERLPAIAESSDVEIVERLKGDAGTEFGVASLSPSADERTVDKAEIDRMQRLLKACWATFDEAVEAAEGVELRKGPRGGGRDLAKIVGHVVESEESYMVQLGVRRPKRPTSDPLDTIGPVRDRILSAIEDRALDRPMADANKVTKRWTPRYFVRRAAWHVLDHAWEIEDRSSP